MFIYMMILHTDPGLLALNSNTSVGYWKDAIFCENQFLVTLKIIFKLSQFYMLKVYLNTFYIENMRVSGEVYIPAWLTYIFLFNNG